MAGLLGELSPRRLSVVVVAVRLDHAPVADAQPVGGSRLLVDERVPAAVRDRAGIVVEPDHVRLARELRQLVHVVGDDESGRPGVDRLDEIRARLYLIRRARTGRGVGLVVDEVRAHCRHPGHRAHVRAHPGVALVETAARVVIPAQPEEALEVPGGERAHLAPAWSAVDVVEAQRGFVVEAGAREVPIVDASYRISGRACSPDGWGRSLVPLSSAGTTRDRTGGHDGERGGSGAART